MKKYFVFSDVHSFYNEWMSALQDAGFDKNNPDHILISLGDLCDRGPDSLKCLNFINSIPQNRKICIIGNHELLLEEMLCRGYPETHDIHNGTMDTVNDVTGIYGHDKESIIEFKSNKAWSKYRNTWKWYYEIGDYIFVHGWIPFNGLNHYGQVIKKPKYNKDWRNMDHVYFEGATWVNGMELWNKGVREEGKTIVCGHWHTSWGHSKLHNYGVEFIDRLETCYMDEKTGRLFPFAEYGPFIDEGIIALDACTVISGKVNVVVIEI